ncbi:hypothetical protein N7481_008183 [Penicillium waksmanii]|uniref:uncharacterized protein n=1 Tax=Penicillium waksmanii TaxID=69791 RepID=UPI0025483232|nr:uncharacterized protein N7481_008183 [Penicillium waksmanii]KAJ5980885.1 hypothetical protein N7481_008183 [Penicillium waksmanii]
MATSIRDVIDSGFSPGITIIAEPGRFCARAAYTLTCRVISRRRQMTSASAAGTPDMLYQHDGIYGNFMNVIMEREVMVSKLARGRYGSRPLLSQFERQRRDGEFVHKYSIWGPTCDSIDRVVREAAFDCEVNIGDWLIYQNIGAYTISTATQLDGFHGSHDKIYVNSEPILDHWVMMRSQFACYPNEAP